MRYVGEVPSGARFPEVVEPLRDGRLCFTSIVEVARVMTPENRAEVLPRFFHASKQEAKAVAAEIAPREAAPHRAVVTAIVPAVHPKSAARAADAPPPPATAPALALALGQESVHPDEPTSRPTPPPHTGAAQTKPSDPVASAAPRTSVEPLTAELRRLHVTVSKRFLEKLDAARDALSHSHPGADAEAILEAGLDLLIERAAKRKGIVSRPRVRAKRSSPTPLDEAKGNPDHIPAAVRREVWIRDGGRCQWPLDGGGACGSTLRLEYDHVVPRARGGGSTIGNLRLCCAMHNQLAARLVFGDAWMERFVRTRHLTTVPGRAAQTPAP